MLGYTSSMALVGDWDVADPGSAQARPHAKGVASAHNTMHSPWTTICIVHAVLPTISRSLCTQGHAYLYADAHGIARGGLGTIYTSLGIDLGLFWLVWVVNMGWTH